MHTLFPVYLLIACVLAMQVTVPVMADAPSDPARSPEFDIIVIPTIQYAHSDIYYRTPPGRVPHFLKTHQLVPDQALDLLVLAKGYATDTAGRATVSYELVTQDPTGKIEPRAKAMLASRQETSPYQLLFPKEVMRFTVTANAPKGAFVFTVTAREHVGNRTVTKSVTIDVASTNDSLPPPPDFDPVQFLMNYHQKPEPRLLVPFLIASAASPLRERPIDGHGALLGFVAGILHDNPWLLPQVEQCLEQAFDEDIRRIASYALAYSQRDVKGYGRHLSSLAQDALKKAKRENMPIPSKKPNWGSQLDLLWGEFFATGRFAPIQQLVQIAEDYTPYRGKLDEYKRMSPRPASIPPDARKDLLLGTTLWSLGSNAYQCKRVGDYLTGIAHHFKDVPPAQRAVAQIALAWRPRSQKPASN